MSRPKGSRRPYAARHKTQRPIEHADGSTDQPEYPELEGREPLPEEITGRASGTEEDLVTLFQNPERDHLADGFRGGSEDDASDADATGTTAPPDELVVDPRDEE
ncbi:MAG: hypothetical protein SFU84_00095 [Gemmatimonadales bacterium]|nr:hypothetical protein [Gemmatimonadales bacterium]